jgi:beta-N-acetylhexosaminidase
MLAPNRSPKHLAQLLLFTALTAVSCGGASPESGPPTAAGATPAGPVAAATSPAPEGAPAGQRPSALEPVPTPVTSPIAETSVRPEPAREPVTPSPAAAGSPAPAPEADPLDAILAGLSTADKVGQLFLAGFEGPDAAGAATAIGELRVGGIALVANATTAGEARSLTSALQQLAQANGLPPLLIAVDHEGGPVQRIRVGVTDLGSNWQLGLVQPIERAVLAACSRGAIHGRELADLGIQMNLAPVLDVLDNPQNTVIGERSYSGDPQTVARLGTAYIQGLQAQGVLAVGKHFPGHGSTTEDSHLTLPVVRHDRGWLDGHELVPFRAAIQANVAAIMTAHVSYPAIDPVSGRPGSLSPVIVSGLLRGDLGYDGLVITDDMGVMEAVTGRYEPGDAAVKAIQAGSDMLIVVGPIERQRRMAQAIVSEVGTSISPEQLDTSVRRVLRAKQQAGLLGTPQPSPAPAGPAC